MDVNEMLVFARVVQAGSFTMAAAKLGMPKSTVSMKVSELEARLIQVVYPSSRHLSPLVKTFVDRLQERMPPPAWELGPMRGRRGA